MNWNLKIMTGKGLARVKWCVRVCVHMTWVRHGFWVAQIDRQVMMIKKAIKVINTSWLQHRPNWLWLWLWNIVFNHTFSTHFNYSFFVDFLRILLTSVLINLLQHRNHKSTRLLLYCCVQFGCATRRDNEQLPGTESVRHGLGAVRTHRRQLQERSHVFGLFHPLFPRAFQSTQQVDIIDSPSQCSRSSKWRGLDSR